MSSQVPLCQPADFTRLPASTKLLSLYLRRVECVDETEHEGIWPFVGEGMANDAIRFRALITSQQGAGGVQRQCKTPVIDLGSNYQDGTVEWFNERLAAVPLAATGKYPLLVNAALLLFEEDWGGQMDEQSEQILRTIGDQVKGQVADATSAAVGAAIGGAIGTALGPLGTTVGAGLGAAIGFIVKEIGAGIAALKTDAFPAQDLSIVLANPSATFPGGGTRLSQQVTFTDHGGQYRLTCEWRRTNADRRVALRTHNGNYVMAVNGGGDVVNAVSTQPSPREWETFVLEDVAASQISLRAYNRQTLSAENGGARLVANRGLVGASETFTVHRLGGERIALRGRNGKFLCAENGGGGDLLFNRDRIAEWETFVLQVL